jgi:glycine betaine catabolism A
MRKELQVACIERLLAVVDRGDLEASCVESTVTIDRYTSAERLEKERRVLFRRFPLIVGRASDVAEPGSFFTHDAAGVPILVTRDQGGTVHAMLNVCRHRGTRLVSENQGTAKAFVCPYHAWTYDLCGRLGHIPLSRCFPTLEREESALVELPCEIRHGFVWVVPTPRSSIDVKTMLGAFDDDFDAFALDEHVVFRRSTSVRSANWKLVMDAFLEGYHVKSLHQRTLSRFFREDVVVDMEGRNVRSVGARKNLLEIASMPRTEWDVRASTTVFYNLFPNSILVFHPDTVSHIALFPRSLGEVEFVHTMLAPREPRTEEERQSWKKTWELIDGTVFAKEDLAIAENIQSVLHANDAKEFKLGSLEYSIRFFHDEIDRALSV